MTVSICLIALSLVFAVGAGPAAAAPAIGLDKTGPGWDCNRLDGTITASTQRRLPSVRARPSPS
jgi:hypothetical protein